MEGSSGGVPMSRGVVVPVNVPRGESAIPIPQVNRDRVSVREAVSARKVPEMGKGKPVKEMSLREFEEGREAKNYADMIVEAAKVEGIDGAFIKLADGNFEEAKPNFSVDKAIASKGPAAKEISEGEVLTDDVSGLTIKDRIISAASENKDLMQSLSRFQGEDGEIDYYKLLDALSQEIEERKKSSEQGSVPLILLILKELIIGTFKETDEVVGLKDHRR